MCLGVRVFAPAVVSLDRDVDEFFLFGLWFRSAEQYWLLNEHLMRPSGFLKRRRSSTRSHCLKKWIESFRSVYNRGLVADIKGGDRHDQHADAAEESVMHQNNDVEIERRNRDEIIFRRLDEPVASWSKPGGRWAVEYWRKEMAYPVALAWVSMPYSPYIDWLYVMEGYRRRGIGSAMLEAIKARWPDVEFDAFTESGEHFIGGIEGTESITNQGNLHDDDCRRSADCL